MTTKSKQPNKTEVNKRKWGLFSKDQRKSVDASPVEAGPPKPVDNGLLKPSNDSTYGSSGEQSNSLTSEGDLSSKSLTVPTSTPSPRPTSPGQSHTDVTHSTHSNPTIRREIHHDPANGTTITTTTTTTTTTTIVSGPNGVTTIEEPRVPVELPAGGSSPRLTLQSAAVSAAINENGQPNYSNQGPQVTPGGRLIPQIHPNEMAGLGRLRSRENLMSPSAEKLPTLPPRSPNRSSFASQSSSTQATITSPFKHHTDFSFTSKNTSAVKSPGAGSTFQNLKTAAAGIHGAAETLRGTVSHNADRRLRSSKTTEADLAKHQQVIDAGRYEIENGRFYARGRQAATKAEEQQQQQQQQEQQRQNDIAKLPSQEPQKTSGGFGKWLHKASSHPSEKRQGGDLRDNQKDKAKLRRRSDGGKLGVLVE